MNRSEFKLLVEGWRNYINEDLSRETGSSDGVLRHFLGKNYDDPNQPVDKDKVNHFVDAVCKPSGVSEECCEEIRKQAIYGNFLGVRLELDKFRNFEKIVNSQISGSEDELNSAFTNSGINWNGSLSNTAKSSEDIGMFSLDDL